MNLGFTGVAAPKAASSSVSRYSRTARGASSGLMFAASHSVGDEEFWRLASASIRLASTAKRWPLTKPSSIHCTTLCSNTWRRRLLSRNRPCRFLENVE